MADRAYPFLEREVIKVRDNRRLARDRQVENAAKVGTARSTRSRQFRLPRNPCKRAAPGPGKPK
eukprot:3714678-Prorocentrum_lima.AAC.1